MMMSFFCYSTFQLRVKAALLVPIKNSKSCIGYNTALIKYLF